MAQPEFGPCPPRFADLKREIAAAYPGFEERATKAWAEVLGELEKATDEIATKGSEVCFLCFGSSCSRRSTLPVRHAIYRGDMLYETRAWYVR